MGKKLVIVESPAKSKTIGRYLGNDYIISASTYGGTAGTTVITITPNYPDAGCRYVYTYGDSVADAAIGDVIVDWNDLTSGFTYEIPNGKKITVAMVNGATFKVVGLGDATVVSSGT